MRLIIGDLFQGRKQYALTKYGANISIYSNLASDIKNKIQGQIPEEEIISEILDIVNDYDITISEESYGGLTPVDESERRFVEIYGRTLIEIARISESVERVVCGLGIILK